MTFKEEIGGIEVHITKKKNLKNMYIRIGPPDGEVRVSVPSNCSDEEIRFFVLEHLPDITKAQEKFKQQPRQSKREYVSGESHYLWGKPYMLEVSYGSKKSSISKTPHKIIMELSNNTDREKREKLLTEWYRKELKSTLEVTVKKCEKVTGLKADEYRVKNMKTRWGTCNIDKKRIWINLQLVKKTMECLEYILTHELVHLVEKNHTYRFHQLVEEYYPDWRNAEKLLSSMLLDFVEKDDINAKKDSV